MASEFYFFCDGKKCGTKVVVTAVPACPKCSLSAMLCDGCIDQHDCRAAREEKEYPD
jgi:hypothetical protein